MDQLWHAIEYVIELVRTVIELNPTSLNQYADSLGPGFTWSCS